MLERGQGPLTKESVYVPCTCMAAGIGTPALTIKSSTQISKG